MLKELRKMRAKGGAERAKANYISTLQHRGKIGTYVSASGYAAYDTEEYRIYRRTTKIGRPIKGEDRGNKDE